MHTSSEGHRNMPGDGFNFAIFKGGPERDSIIGEWSEFVAPWYLYGASKMVSCATAHIQRRETLLSPCTLSCRAYGAILAQGNIAISNILHRYHGTEVMSCALHPGGVKTSVLRTTPWWQATLLNFMFYPVALGAQTQLWAGTSEEGEGFGGKVSSAMVLTRQQDAGPVHRPTRLKRVVRHSTSTHGRGWE